MRWLFHVLPTPAEPPAPNDAHTDARYRAPSLETEGFIHASYRDMTLESARLYFPAGADLRVLAIDPRRLDVPVDVVDTPRGPMPHIHGSIPLEATRWLTLDDVEAHPDRITGTRIALCAFDGMTLLDLVGPLDALSRIASMGFEPTTTCELIALTRGEHGAGPEPVVVWSGGGATLTATRYRPLLDAFDVLVVPGGPGARALVEDREVIAYLRSFPQARLLASVCTGALLLGAVGRLGGKRASTHASARSLLAGYGATATSDRVVDEGNIVTAGGVTAGIDLGLHLVQRLEGSAVRDAIALQMEHRGGA